MLMFTAVVTSNFIPYKGHRPQSLSSKGQIVCVGDRGAGDNEWCDSCYSPSECYIEYILIQDISDKLCAPVLTQPVPDLFSCRAA
jgi:hypothetical protein